MACDGILRGAPVRLHRAVSVHAPTPVVFSWLCQLKLAPYSYDLLDNLGRTSPRELVPGLDHLAAGQRFMTIFSLISFVTNEHVTLRGPRVAVTYAVLASNGPTRLVARVLFLAPGRRIASALAGHALALGDLVMMRKQLLTLKALAERDAKLTRIVPVPSGYLAGSTTGGIARRSSERSTKGPSLSCLRADR